MNELLRKEGVIQNLNVSHAKNNEILEKARQNLNDDSQLVQRKFMKAQSLALFKANDVTESYEKILNQRKEEYEKNSKLLTRKVNDLKDRL